MSGTTDNANRGPGGAPRWVMVALLTSLMVNMVFVGVVAGRFWAQHHGSSWHSRHKNSGMRAFLRDLPEARRTELGQMMRANREAARAERENIRTLRQAVREAIVREPFDKAALETALSQVNAARQSFRARVAVDFADMVAKMTPDERKAFAEKGLRRHRRHPRRDM